MWTTSDLHLAGEFRLHHSHGEDGRYNHVRLGFNFRLTDFAVALGQAHLGGFPAAVRRRRRNAALLCRAMAGLAEVELPWSTEEMEHTYNLYTIQLHREDLGVSRDQLQRELHSRDKEFSATFSSALLKPQNTLYRRIQLRKLGHLLQQVNQCEVAWSTLIEIARTAQFDAVRLERIEKKQLVLIRSFIEPGKEPGLLSDPSKSLRLIVPLANKEGVQQVVFLRDLRKEDADFSPDTLLEILSGPASAALMRLQETSPHPPEPLDLEASRVSKAQHENTAC